MLHRLKALRSNNHKSRNTQKSFPSLEKFIEDRDYVGATTYLNYSDTNEVKCLLWKAYCAFHNHEYEKAQDIYINLLSGDYKDGDVPEETILFLACVYNSMQLYSEALEAAQDGPDSALKTRLIYFLSQKLGRGDHEDFDNDINVRQRLDNESVEDQLCQAAVLYSQCNFQGACEIYKQLLAEDKSRLALNYYIAMCYFKMVRHNSSYRFDPIHLFLLNFVFAQSICS